MKKIAAAALALLILLSASGCGGKSSPNKVYAESDLTGKNIGVVTGTAGTVYADGFGLLYAYASAESMLVDVKNAVLDCAVMDEDEARAALRKVSGLAVLKQPLVEAAFCFAIAKENPDLTEDVNEALDFLMDEGIVKSIIEGYEGQSDFVYESPEDIDRSVGSLTIAFDGSFPPYSYDDGSGTIVGIDVDIARAVCDMLHVEMVVSIVDKDELVTTVQSGKAALALGGVTNNEEDAQLVDFSDPYTECTQVIIVRK